MGKQEHPIKTVRCAKAKVTDVDNKKKEANYNLKKKTHKPKQHFFMYKGNKQMFA